MAERAKMCRFPVLVQGAWGSPDPPKILRNKILRYFQSRKKSGGGECEIRKQGGQILVCFAQEEVRQRVLSQTIHELDVTGRGTVKLEVSLYEATDPDKDNAAKEEIIPKKALNEEGQAKEKEVQDCQTQNVTLRSGPAGDAPYAEKNILNYPQRSSQVVLENVEENIHPDTLTQLVDNINALSGDGTFHIEQINEKKAAVITFQQSTAAANFLKQCSKNRRFQQYRLTARPLELTNVIKVENIPAATSSEFLTLYFESPKKGGGQVSDIQMLPTEDSALVKFDDSQAALTALKKQHSLNGQSVLVYPFYSSLDTVLYGKEKPQIKMPESISVPLDPYIWQFLQGKNTLIQEIEKEMANCFCEVIWPQATCEQPELVLSPSAILAKKRKSIKQLVKSWKDKVSEEFACILSKFETVKCKIIPEAWETLESNLLKNVLAVPDDSKNCVTLAGFAFTVGSVEKELREYIEHLTKDAEIAGQTLQQTLSISPVKYKVLQHILLEENISEENTGLKWSYDASAKQLQLNGIPTEVYKMKSDLLEKMFRIVEKNVNIHPSIFQFLQNADPVKLSWSLFTANKINAAYELTHDSIALVGYSPEDLLKAEEQIKKCLNHKCITLKDQELIHRKQWKELIKHLQKLNNSVEESIIIEDWIDLDGEAKIIVAGYTTVVADVYQQLSDFVERNTHMQTVIPAKSVAMVQFIEEAKQKVWCDLNKKGLIINFGLLPKQKDIVLSGPKVEVTEAAVMVQQMLSLLHSVNVVFDKPGVKDLFRNQEHYYVNQVKTDFNCLIRLQRDDEKNGGSSENVEHLQTKVDLKNGVVIQVCMGDLTRYQADVVVNASNEALKHIGGLANALLKAAGPQLQDECDGLIQKHGELKPGCAVITGAWNLPCKQVIHAVGPRWTSANKENCIQLLKKAVRESLKLAEKFSHRSIAIPAISSGIFGFPIKECTHSILTAIKETLEQFSENSSLKQICLVDTTPKTVQAFSDALREVFKSGPPLPTSLSSPSISQVMESEDDLVVTSHEGLKLFLEEKGIEDATTDVIVSTIGEDLKLGVGPLSKAVLQKAGVQLQDEFDQVVQDQGALGNRVIQTDGHNLSCVLFHVIVPQWDAGKGSAIKKLQNIMRKCLERTEMLSLKSISFPAIGTGGFNFPNSEVAKCMFKEILTFSRKKNFKSLQKVHVLLHPKDKDNIKAFTEVFRSGIDGVLQAAPPSSEEMAGFFGSLSTSALGSNEMQIGSITFQSMIGDIIKENTDVIVNLTNENFTSKLGVSKAILEAAGPEIEAECARLASQPHNGFVTTQNGKLTCKKIIHLAPCSSIKPLVSKVLQECEAKQYVSVAFPVIGTGQRRGSPDEAADDIISAVADFAGKQLPRYLKLVKVVVFQPHMQKSFSTILKNKEGRALPTSESVLSKIKGKFKVVSSFTSPAKKKKFIVLEKKIETSSFEICGENKKNVEEAEAWLRKLIFKEQTENHIVDELIDTFADAEIKRLNDLQKRLHIAIHLNKTESPPFILVSGIPRDVLTAFTEIQNLLKTLKADQEKKSKAELVKVLVEWQYCANGNAFLPFNTLSNLDLEDAKISKKGQIQVQIRGQKYTADLNKMCVVDSQGKSMKIKRVGKDEGKLLEHRPEHWEDMKGNHVKLVPLQPTAGEYKNIEKIFRIGCPTFTIEKIERVQNPYLWQAYQVKKKQIDTQNGHGNNEKILFHGTPFSTVVPIYQTGFNRSYAGKNAAVIGNGTYFAVCSNYSAQDTYAPPDANGRKYMYVGRVLTGDYCIGRSGQIIPPSKNNGGFDIYDSVTDNMNRPSMFVIFHDAQAYPEYLITFRR
ncbi:protein mono-ADP-ribosyltransferase PARP14 [Protobothrops mucrosquamatus]|uniref:protein mono-ADP-ribosyltransferase PARP14 n=1 Tax=Protobothrops mucrosquamatus TaxID=103944 RepID=UPI0010FB0865|nr:protein mono-ADP-ribosyltransferase PARP14 [Protobothrops mucrosquamatus]